VKRTSRVPTAGAAHAATTAEFTREAEAVGKRVS